MAAPDRLLDAARNLDPVRPASGTRDGLYVTPPDGGLHGWIVSQCAREPQSHLLALGGIGSGKTTELLHARDALLARGGFLPSHLPLDAYFDLGSLTQGQLLTLAGLAMLKALADRGEPIVGSLRDIAVRLHGFVRSDRPAPEALLLSAFLQHRAMAPAIAVEDLWAELAPLIERWRKTQASRNGIVLLIDALDRRPFDDFLDVTRDDLPRLRDLGVAVVIVGNLAWRHRHTADLDASLHGFRAQLLYDPALGPHADFLREVVERRAPGLFPKDVLQALVQASGGAMRDLLHLARETVYEARALGEEAPSFGSLHKALTQMRESRLATLNNDQWHALEQLQLGEQPPTSLGDQLQARGCAVLRGRVLQVHSLFSSSDEQSRAA